MKKLAAITLALLLPAIPAFAQNEAVLEPVEDEVLIPVLEQPNKLLAGTRAVIDYLEPTPELGVFVSLKNLGDKNLSQFESFAGISASIYKFESQGAELGSWRLGGVFEGNRKLYSTVAINGIGLAKRYFSEDMKETLSPGAMSNVWDFWTTTASSQWVLAWMMWRSYSPLTLTSASALD